MSEQIHIRKVFDNVFEHQRIASVIQRFSTNKHNVLTVAQEGLDLKHCRQILDLGCAFGSFTESLKGRVSPDATVTGVDTVAAYGPLYLAACQRASLRGRFSNTGAAQTLKACADGSFDLALCSYALYFFPEAIPEIARVLRAEGLLVVITHGRRNAADLIDVTKKILASRRLLRGNKLPMEALLNRFSSENGHALLQPWFKRVKKIDFCNSLSFSKKETRQLLDYFRFKSPLYFMNAGAEPETLLPLVLENLERISSEQNGITISKDDCIFSCALPRHKERNT